MDRILTKHYEYGEEEIHYLKQVDPELGAAQAIWDRMLK